ncbi:MAG TPA: SDR family oxidoreductase [Candidatus Nanopelagicales bacterium]|nr:SDR family oxidoreductase [Candidatus Nanopelagicales bacterium]
MQSPLRVMVTAGASGIGAAIASRFAAEGALVSVLDADPEAVAAVTGMHAVVGDCSSPSVVDAWFDDRLAAWGGLDVLVNNAGIAGPTAYVEEMSFADWRETLAVGLDSHFLTSRRAAAAMKGQGSGSIVAISSTAGLYGYGMRSPYAAAKWAVIGLVKSLAIELGPHGVRVNAICPGSVDGPRMRGVIEREAEARGVEASLVEREYVQGQSIHRFVDASEIADLAWFLASPAAAMITGQAIAVDGHTETFHL